MSNAHPVEPHPGPLLRGFAAARRHLADPVYRNGYFLMLNSMSGAGFGFLFWLLAARVWSPRELGWGAGAVSAMTLVALLGKFGLDAGLIRFVPSASVRGRRRLVALSGAWALGLSFAFAVAFLALVPSVMPELLPLTRPRTAAAFALFAAAVGAGWVLDAYFIAEQRAEFSFLRNLVLNLVRLLVPVVAVAQGSAFGIPLAWGLGACASVAVGSVFVPGLARRARGASEGPPMGRFLRYSGLNYVHNVSEFLPGLAFPLLVLAALGPEANARFYIAWTFAFVAFLASKSIAQSTFAQLATAAGHPRAPLAKGLLQHVLVLVPFVAGTVLLGRWLLSFFGPDYAEGYALLVLLVASSFPVGAVNLYLVLLKATDAGPELVVLPVLLLGLSLGGAYALVPRFGLVGVGAAWAAANGLVAAWAVPRTLRALDRLDPGRSSS